MPTDRLESPATRITQAESLQNILKVLADLCQQTRQGIQEVEMLLVGNLSEPTPPKGRPAEGLGRNNPGLLTTVTDQIEALCNMLQEARLSINRIAQELK